MTDVEMTSEVELTATTLAVGDVVTLASGDKKCGIVTELPFSDQMDEYFDDDFDTDGSEEGSWDDEDEDAQMASGPETPISNDKDKLKKKKNPVSSAFGSLEVPECFVRVSFDLTEKSVTGELYHEQDIVLVDRADLLVSDIVTSEDGKKNGRVVALKCFCELEPLQPNGGESREVDSLKLEDPAVIHGGCIVSRDGIMGKVLKLEQRLVIGLMDGRKVQDVNQYYEICDGYGVKPGGLPSIRKFNDFVASMGKIGAEDVIKPDEGGPTFASQAGAELPPEDKFSWNFKIGDLVLVHHLQLSKSFLDKFKKSGGDIATLAEPAIILSVDIMSASVSFAKKVDGSRQKEMVTEKIQQKDIGSLKTLRTSEIMLPYRVRDIVCIRGDENRTMYRIVRTRTLADVQWQDGTIERGLKSVDIRVSTALAEDDLFPGDVVHDDGHTRSGVIQSCDVKERHAIVHWISDSKEKQSDPVEVSMYALMRCGDSLDIGRHVMLAPDKATGILKAGVIKERLMNGKLRVEFFSEEPGSEKAVVGHALLPELMMWGTAKDGPISPTSKSEAHFGYMFAENDSSDDMIFAPNGDIDHYPYHFKSKKSKSKEANATSSEVALLPLDHDTNEDQEISTEDKTPTFQIVETDVPTQNQFYRTQAKEPSKGLMKRIKQELRVLQTSLPERGIYVRGFESRMDILQVLYIGPEHTPYQDMTFLFDLFIPPEYPSKPPRMRYRSCSRRLNPNLYEDGTVCLSLLGTWHGKEGERWQESCTLLQVILSVQGLVLNKYPYFNEPGFETQRNDPEGQHKSSEYNEAAYVHSMQTATFVLTHIDSCEPYQEALRELFTSKNGILWRRIIPTAESLLAKDTPGETEMGVTKLSKGAKQVVKSCMEKLQALETTKPE